MTLREAAEEIVGPHFYFDEDRWYSCGLAVGPGTKDEPGDGCSDPEAKGRCTCRSRAGSRCALEAQAFPVQGRGAV